MLVQVGDAVQSQCILAHSGHGLDCSERTANVGAAGTERGDCLFFQGVTESRGIRRCQEVASVIRHGRSHGSPVGARGYAKQPPAEITDTLAR